MGSVNEINTKIDPTVRVFDEFYSFGLEVPANEYDAIYSYFLRVFNNRTQAGNFTVQIFRIADQTQQNPLTVLSQIQDADKIKMTASIAYYLNGIQSPSTLLGINAAVTPNVWAARNVRP